jgi:hypothetical protein
MKFNPCFFLEETSELDPKSQMLLMRIICHHFSNKKGFEIVENDDKNLTKTSQKACKKLHISKGNANKIAHLLITFCTEIDSFLWHFPTYEAVSAMVEKSLIARKSAESRWKIEKEKGMRLHDADKREEKEEKEEIYTLKESENVFSDIETEPVPPTVKIPYSLNENGSVTAKNYNSDAPKKINPDLPLMYRGYFLEFWDVYPRAESQNLAENAFYLTLQYQGVTAEYLIERAKILAKMLKAGIVEKKFVPQPHNWLEKGNFNDRTLDEFMDAPVTAKEANAGLLEHEVLLKEKTLYHKPTGRLIETEGVEVKKTQFGDYVMRFSNGTIAEVGQLDIPHPEMLKGA